MKNIIYKITNLQNNKVYIGLTTQGLARRKGEHIYRLNSGERDHKLYNAMRKYGINSFSFESICSALLPEHLGELEQYFIKEYNSFNRGYNMTIGGDTVSQETRDKLSAIFKGRKITWYNKILESRSKNKNNKTKKYHTILTTYGTTFETRDLSAFCKIHNMDVSNFYHYSKKSKFLKGYLWLESSTTSSFERRD